MIPNQFQKKVNDGEEGKHQLNSCQQFTYTTTNSVHHEIKQEIDTAVQKAKYTILAHFDDKNSKQFIHSKSKSVPKDKLFVCTRGLCGKKFAYKSSLRKHITSIHDDIKCGECGVSFTKISKMKLHIRTVHEGLRPQPHQCTICFKTFSQMSENGNFKRHMKSCTKKYYLKLMVKSIM